MDGVGNWLVKILPVIDANDVYTKCVYVLSMGVGSVAYRKCCCIRGVVLTGTSQTVVVGFGGVMLGGVRCYTGLNGLLGRISAGTREGSCYDNFGSEASATQPLSSMMCEAGDGAGVVFATLAA